MNVFDVARPPWLARRTACHRLRLGRALCCPEGAVLVASANRCPGSASLCDTAPEGRSCSPTRPGPSARRVVRPGVRCIRCGICSRSRANNAAQVCEGLGFVSDEGGLRLGHAVMRKSVAAAAEKGDPRGPAASLIWRPRRHLGPPLDKALQEAAPAGLVGLVAY